MLEIDQLLKQIASCREFNKKWALDAGSDQEEIDSDATLLSQLQLNLDRVRQASKINPAIGVFGQSQCGKSYLISELIGGKTKHLVIPSVTTPKFQDYNRQNVDAESTGVVTRLTFNDSREGAPDGHVRVRFLTPLDVMWSFVFGFYNEMDFSKGFELTEEEKNECKLKINNIQNNEGPILKNILETEFSECFSFVKNKYVEPPLAAFCVNHLRQNDSSSFSIESFILYASSLWNFNKNISDAFEARIRTLEYLDFIPEGYLPEELLKNTIDASKLNSLKLKFNNTDMFSNDDGLIIPSANPNNEEVRIQNLQAIVKEVELTVEEDDQSLLNQVDVLDFPGARALSGQFNSPTAFQIAGEISDSSSIMIKNMFKRGKLLYLFELYRKQFDITLLLFCSEHANQEAPVLRTMLNSWISMEVEENAEDPGLFVAFTKSDKLLYSDDHMLRKTDDVDARVTARFNANFSEYYGSWVNNFLNTNKPFSNFYFVRNPGADNTAFQFVGEEEQWINDNFKLSSGTFRDVFMENSVAENFLGNNKEVLYDSCFYPGKNGIQYLIKSINNKLTSDPQRKDEFLNNRINKIRSAIIEYVHKYYVPGGISANEERERKDALSFVDKLDQDEDYLPELLNGFYRTCPGEQALYQFMEEILQQNQNKTAITIPPVYEKAIPLFVSEWIHLCKTQADFSDSIGVEETDLNKFLDKMKRYFLQPDFIEPIIEDFNNYFEIADYSSARIIRNYLSWILGEKLYYLEYLEENGTPDSPVTVPQKIDFNSYIISIWKQQLPEIYVENFKMRQETDGIKLLKPLV